MIQIKYWIYGNSYNSIIYIFTIIQVLNWCTCNFTLFKRTGGKIKKKIKFRVKHSRFALWLGQSGKWVNLLNKHIVFILPIIPKFTF